MKKLSKLILIVLFSFPFVSQGALIDDLISYWTLNETSGARLDSHGENDLTDNNTVGSATGVVSGGANFIHTNAENLTKTSTVGLSFGTGQFSISGWFKIAGNGTGSSNGHTFFLANNTSHPSLRLSITTTSASCSWYDGANGADATKSGMTNTGVWVHLVCVRDSGTSRLYVNGVEEATGSNTWGTSINANLTLNNLALGKGLVGTAGAFQGDMDEIGIWGRTLTTSEITELYNSGDGVSYSTIANVGGGEGGSATTTVEFSTGSFDIFYIFFGMILLLFGVTFTVWYFKPRRT